MWTKSTFLGKILANYDWEPFAVNNMLPFGNIDPSGLLEHIFLAYPSPFLLKFLNNSVVLPQENGVERSQCWLLIHSEVSSYYALTRLISAGTRVTSQYLIPRDPGYLVAVTIWKAFATVVIRSFVNPQLAPISLIPHLNGLIFSAAIDVAGIQPVGQLVDLLPLVGLAVGDSRTHFRADKLHAGTFRDRVSAEELVLPLI